MTLEQLFTKVLDAEHTQLAEETASFYTEREGDTLRILFEESNGKTDWRNNFRFLAIPTKPYKDMKDVWFAHRGFLRVWKVIEPHLAEQISDLSVERIEIAGYSHGGAIALLCFEYCKYHRPDIPVSGVGFGAPRVLWGPVPETVKARVADFLVVRNGNDLITHLPPKLFGYRQMGRLQKVGISVDPIRDHYPEEYQTAL
jgi:hypothetical protein